MIQLYCPQCGKQLKVKDEAAGKKGKCPTCGATILIPASDAGTLSDYTDAPMEAPPPKAPFDRKNRNQSSAGKSPQRDSGPASSIPTINVNLQKRTSSLGVVSLILGVTAFLICWIPFIGMLSIPLSGLGLLLAVIGVCLAVARHGAGIGWPVGGGVVSGIALMVAFAQVAVISGAADAIQKSADNSNRTKQEIISPDGSGNAQSISRNNQTMANETEWASAQNAVRQGDMQIQVVHVLTGKIPLRSNFDGTAEESDNDLLTIHIELKNISSTKKIGYQTWQGKDLSFTRDYATLQDNFGNGYKRVTFGFSTTLVGQTDVDSIYPGQKISDIIVFELPVGTIKYLNLELPASNFGGEGMIRLRIPVAMIRSR